MMVLVTYDVSTVGSSGAYRLRKIAKICENFGIRVQNSVFECTVDPGQWVTMRNDLLKQYRQEKDSLRFYFLGSNWKRRIEHHGCQVNPDIHETLII